jgi:DNA-binding FadR family transcriptional regulator
MTRRQDATAAVKVRTLPGQVASHLVPRIVDGEFPDRQAPSESEICQEFGVSRSVARESLKILASLDIVQIAQGRRVTIRPLEEWDYLNPMLAEWLPEQQVRQLLRELHGMRLLLEPELAAMAADGISAGALAELRALVERMSGLENAPDEYLEADLAFHMEICRAAQNRVLDRIMFSARWLLTASRKVTNEGPKSLRGATRDHSRIFAAIEADVPDSGQVPAAAFELTGVPAPMIRLLHPHRARRVQGGHPSSHRSASRSGLDNSPIRLRIKQLRRPCSSREVDGRTATESAGMRIQRRLATKPRPAPTRQECGLAGGRGPCRRCHTAGR